MNYAFDTNIMCAIARAHALGLPSRLLSDWFGLLFGGEIALPSVVFYEMERGAAGGAVRWQVIVSQQEACEACRPLPLTADALSVASDLWALNREHDGRRFGELDLLIFATCVEHERVLVTADQGLIEAVHGLPDTYHRWVLGVPVDD